MILVTGCCGFIGLHLVSKLIKEGNNVVGIDNMNKYYDPQLKKSRLDLLIHKSKNSNSNFIFLKIDIRDKVQLMKLFDEYNISLVCHLAAQAGVRYSIDNPDSYVSNNIQGTINLLECCKKADVNRFIFASTSSVYGTNTNIPYDENQSIDSVISTYSASKRTGELLLNVYNNLFGIKVCILRFFTVYGPWGRPDMALFKFTKNIIEDLPIEVYNNGDMLRDFTYVDDIVSGFVKAKDFDFNNEIFNLGNGDPVKLLDFIKILEHVLNKNAIINFRGMQLGDVKKTYADISKSKKILNFSPKVKVEQGIQNFVNWYVNNYN